MGEGQGNPCQWYAMMMMMMMISLGVNLYSRYKSNTEFWAKNLEIDLYADIYSM